MLDPHIRDHRETRRRCRLRLVVRFARLVLGAARGLGRSRSPAPPSRSASSAQPEQVVSVSKGASVLVITQTPLQRFSIGDPTVAEAVVVSPTEVLVNGKTLGTTTLVLWDNAGAPRLYSVEVTADAPGLERYLHTAAAGRADRRDGDRQLGDAVGPGARRQRRPTGRSRSPRAAAPPIIDNLSTPDAVQVLLQVRFAEVNRTALKQFSSQIATLNIHTA